MKKLGTEKTLRILKLYPSEPTKVAFFMREGEGEEIGLRLKNDVSYL